MLRGEVYDGVGACKRMEQWLIDNHSFQALYAVTELTEKDFWVMFDQTLYRCGISFEDFVVPLVSLVYLLTTI